ncbi:MAG: hypothetical protein ACTSQI_01130 [Candidatus Helarchaeota archaeon]
MIKIDSCSLIYSIKLDILDKIQRVYEEIIISPTVKTEVIDQGKIKQKPDAFIAENLLNQKKVKVHSPKSLVKNFNLGLGEIEIFSLAIDENCPCLIDDIRAQKLGITLGINLKSIPIILLELFKKDIISKDEYLNYIERYGRIVNSSQVEIWFYKKVGELIP